MNIKQINKEYQKAKEFELRKTILKEIREEDRKIDQKKGLLIKDCKKVSFNSRI